MALNYSIVLFLLGIVHFSLGKECYGCPHKLDIKDPAIQKYLESKLHELKRVVPKGIVDDRELKLVRVKDAQEKIVAGLEYSYEFEAKGLSTEHMYDCKLTVLKKLWLAQELVTGYSCNLVLNGNEKVLPGKEYEIDVRNNSKLEELKSFLGQEITKSQKSEYMMTVLTFLKATMQVVEGIVIRTTLQIGVTNCHMKVDEECEHSLRGKQVCDVEVWVKPWMKYREIIQVECKPMFPLDRACAGCPIEKDPKSPFVKQSLEKALEKINNESYTGKKLALLEINKATLQVVHGSILTVYFDAEDQKTHNKYFCKAVIMLPMSTHEEQTVNNFNCIPVLTNSY